MAKKTSPTVRSLALLRERGYIAEVVERWNPYARVRQDLFNCIDIVALRNGELLGVQTTTTANMGARVGKVLAEPAMKAWVDAGGSLVVHGWAKRGARGKPKVWTLKEVAITRGEFPEIPSCEPLTLGDKSLG